MIITGNKWGLATEPTPRQKEQITSIDIKHQIKLALIEYKLNEGNYPISSEDFHRAVVDYFENRASKPRQGFIIDAQVVDLWGNPYQYKFPGSKNTSGDRGYDLWSLGQDGILSDDDIGNWEKGSNQTE